MRLIKGLLSFAIIAVMALLLVTVLDALAQNNPSGKPAAEVNGQAITEEEIDKAIAGQLGKLQEQIYTLRRQRLDSVVRERLLAAEAAKRGVSVQRLLDNEVTSKVTLVTEEEVEKFFEANKAQIKPDADQAEIRDQIRGRLQSQKIATQREAFIESLRKTAKVAIHLQAPPVQRVDVPINGAPVKGAAKAPVTIVEFSDFHCPFCKRVLPTLKQIEEKYGDKVKIAFRDYPIDQLHPDARKAHEAARCATEQGKFWPYHDLLFENAPRTSREELTAYAKMVGLDVGRFGQCVSSGKYKEVVQKDIDEGARLGVTGTPAYFINGRLVSGAQPLERFAQVIDEELLRKQ